MASNMPRRVIVICAALCMVCAFMFSVQAEAKAGDLRDRALLIGVSDYSDTCKWGDLYFCHKDAMDMRDMLIEQFGWKSSDIMVLVNESATEANIVEGINWLKKANGMAIFYFSGHGDFYPEVQAIPNGDEVKDQAIIPYDGDTTALEHLMFDDVMIDYFAGMKAESTILVFDSCYSGGLIDELGVEGRMILSSCEINEMCWEGGSKKAPFENGVYTYCLMQALDGAGDVNGDGSVSLDEAAAYAEDHVGDYTQQVHPVTYDGISGETFL